eukprot:1137454-Pelagomonas_calceolata.AAC.1
MNKKQGNMLRQLARSALLHALQTLKKYWKHHESTLCAWRRYRVLATFSFLPVTFIYALQILKKHYKHHRSTLGAWRGCSV